MRNLALCVAFAAFVVGCGQVAGPDGSVSPGQCSSQKVWTTPSAGGVSVARVGSGYYLAAGRDASDGWAKVQSNGRPETMMPVPRAPDVVLGSAVMLSADAGDRLVRVYRGTPASASGMDQSFVTGVLKRGSLAYTPPTPLVTAFYRGTILNDFRTSFDGRRALFATGHSSVEEPLAVMVGPDGQRMGAETGVTTADGLFELGVVSTLHGGVLSVLEHGDGARTWHAVELDATGTVAMRAKVDVGEGARSVVAAEGPQGLIVAWIDAAGEPHLARLDRTGSAVDGPHPLPVAAAQILGLAAMSSGVVVLARDAEAKVGVVWLDDAGGLIHALPLANTKPGVAWIPTEAGLLAFTEVSEDGTVSLTEITCGPS